MGYRVKPLPHLQKRSWKLQFIDYRGDKEKIRDIPETEYARLGFKADMTYEEATLRKNQLNAQGHIKSVEAKRATIARRMSADEEVLNAFLSSEDVRDFEDTVFLVGKDRRKKATVWKAARLALADLKVEPQKWNYRKVAFYEWMRIRQYSPSYCQKVIMALNAWGEFQAMKYGFYFKQLEFPKGENLHRISEAYYDKAPDGRESKPLTPEKLESLKERIKPEWYNWYYLSVWFGLRPPEVDQLLDEPGKRSWSIVEAESVDGSTVTCLRIYQSKLVKIAPEKRYKLIPVIVPQQKKGLEIIKGQAFRRPSHVRHVIPHLGEGYYLNAGRKGFSMLMRKFGQSQVNYSRWLGHTTIDRTEKDYEQKEVIEFAKPKRAKRSG